MNQGRFDGSAPVWTAPDEVFLPNSKRHFFRFR